MNDTCNKIDTEHVYPRIPVSETNDSMANWFQWRHNKRDGVSNHRCFDWLLNRLFRHRSKKHQSSASLAFVRGIHRWPVDSPHNGPATLKMLPFDDVIVFSLQILFLSPTNSPRRHQKTHTIIIHLCEPYFFEMAGDMLGNKLASFQTYLPTTHTYHPYMIIHFSFH